MREQFNNYNILYCIRLFIMKYLLWFVYFKEKLNLINIIMKSITYK